MPKVNTQAQSKGWCFTWHFATVSECEAKIAAVWDWAPKSEIKRIVMQVRTQPRYAVPKWYWYNLSAAERSGKGMRARYAWDRSAHTSRSSPPKIPLAFLQTELAATTGKAHIQGFVLFSSNWRFKRVQKLMPGAHIEPMRGTQNEAADYCEKNDTRAPGCKPFSYGTASKQGERTDISKLSAYILADKRTNVIAVRNDVAVLFPDEFMRSARNIESLIAATRPGFVSTAVKQLRPWQAALAECSRASLDPAWDRKVYLVRDELGSSGKTCMAKWIAANGETCILNGDTYANMAYMYQFEPYLVVDCARGITDNLLREIARFVEDAKNEHITSGKYQSQIKRGKSPFVVIFLNRDFPPGLLSADREVRITLMSQGVGSEWAHDVPVYPDSYFPDDYLREKKGLGSSAVAAALGVEPPAASCWLQGREVGLDTAELVIGLLGNGGGSITASQHDAWLAEQPLSPLAPPPSPVEGAGAGAGGAGPSSPPGVPALPLSLPLAEDCTGGAGCKCLICGGYSSSQ